MHEGVTNSDRVLLVCTDAYVSKSNAGTGGAGYEKLIVSAEVVQSIDTTKFIPIIRGQAGATRTPTFLGSRLYVDFRNDADYEFKLEELAREVHGMPAVSKPPLGSNPFSGELQQSEKPLRTTDLTGKTREGVPVLSQRWFDERSEKAKAGLLKVGLLGSLELRFALQVGINKTQIELLDGVRASEVHTFGWPIGVTLENRDEYKPRPTADGIEAEVAIANGSTTGRISYDYWSLARQGDFYLTQSLFEDSRGQNLMFFNTRIVRIAEALIFASNLYHNLGAPPATMLSARITHDGLVGRSLQSSNPNRLLHDDRKCMAPRSQTEFVVELGAIRSSLVDQVMQVAEPLFMLFDFAKFGRDIYRDIVTRFESGEVT